MATTLTIAAELIFGILSADATFKGYLTGVGSGVCIFRTVAPQTALPLYCIIGVQSPGVDTLSSPGAYRILSNPLLRVVVCGPQSSKANIESAYARADALLCPNGGPTRNTSGTLALYRESPFEMPEPELVNGEEWVNFGGMYRVIL